jgi:hypothetical protein
LLLPDWVWAVVLLFSCWMFRREGYIQGLSDKFSARKSIQKDQALYSVIQYFEGKTLKDSKEIYALCIKALQEDGK